MFHGRQDDKGNPCSSRNKSAHGNTTACLSTYCFPFFTLPCYHDCIKHTFWQRGSSNTSGHPHTFWHAENSYTDTQKTAAEVGYSRIVGAQKRYGPSLNRGLEKSTHRPRWFSKASMTWLGHRWIFQGLKTPQRGQYKPVQKPMADVSILESIWCLNYAAECIVDVRYIDSTSLINRPCFLVCELHVFFLMKQSCLIKVPCFYRFYVKEMVPRNPILKPHLSNYSWSHLWVSYPPWYQESTNFCWLCIYMYTVYCIYIIPQYIHPTISP